jgi:glycosyltransferase involved in cell wall biosynthesis
MNMHSVMVTYNRLDLTTQALTSYREHTVGPWTLTVVDNDSTDETREWLLANCEEFPFYVMLLPENRYPGFATNRGWEVAPEDTVLLHRADNDFVFLPGWDTHVRLRFSTDVRLGQLGLRTDEEELHNQHNVGGNCVIRKQLFDEGLRYDERPWPKIAKKVPGYTEDSFLSPQVKKMGWEWGRVTEPCIRPISSEDPEDEYYIRSWRDRGIQR